LRAAAWLAALALFGCQPATRVVLPILSGAKEALVFVYRDGAFCGGASTISAAAVDLTATRDLALAANLSLEHVDVLEYASEIAPPGTLRCTSSATSGIALPAPNVGVMRLQHDGSWAPLDPLPSEIRDFRIPGGPTNMTCPDLSWSRIVVGRPDHSLFAATPFQTTAQTGVLVTTQPNGVGADVAAVWELTPDSGPTLVLTATPDPTRFYTAIHRSADQNIWLGDDGGVLRRYDSSGRPTKTSTRLPNGGVDFISGPHSRVYGAQLFASVAGVPLLFDENRFAHNTSRPVGGIACVAWSAAWEAVVGGITEMVHTQTPTVVRYDYDPGTHAVRALTQPIDVSQVPSEIRGCALVDGIGPVITIGAEASMDMTFFMRGSSGWTPIGHKNVGRPVLGLASSNGELMYGGFNGLVGLLRNPPENSCNPIMLPMGNVQFIAPLGDGTFIAGGLGSSDAFHITRLW
jgi:hypothetical protein